MSDDHAYKRFFSNPRMVRDLLRGFITADWVTDLDLDSLERVNGNYVTDDLRERSDDVVWRLRFRGRWLYLYLLLEFQSTVDRHMAVRILSYIGLLYQDLIRTQVIDAGSPLPPVLPVVLYNGERRWTAACSLEECFPEDLPAALRAWLPTCRYWLIDEGRLDRGGLQALEPQQNLVAALVQAELSDSPEQVHAVIKHLIAWLSSPDQQGLRRDFTEWFRRMLVRRMKGVAADPLNDLEEIDTMLSERVKSWEERWEEKGKAAGMERGLQRGLEQGLQQGMEQGLQQGMEQGLQKGMEQGLQQGMEQGLQEGRKNGEQSLLTRQLAKRFGDVPEWARQRLDAADTTQLESWGEKLLDAKSLQDVFD
jgi:hypothetical protein